MNKKTPWLPKSVMWHMFRLPRRIVVPNHIVVLRIHSMFMGCSTIEVLRWSFKLLRMLKVALQVWRRMNKSNSSRNFTILNVSPARQWVIESPCWDTIRRSNETQKESLKQPLKMSYLWSVKTSSINKQRKWKKRQKNDLRFFSHRMDPWLEKEMVIGNWIWMPRNDKVLRSQTQLQLSQLL